MAKVSHHGIPVTTTSSAALHGMRMLGVKKMTFVGPYDEEVTERGRIFFEQNGFDVKACRGLGLQKDKDVGAVLERVYHLVRETTHPDCDGVFISCTNLRTVGAIAALEADLGIPVVSAIQSSFWHAIRIAGINRRQTRFRTLVRILTNYATVIVQPPRKEAR